MPFYTYICVSVFTYVRSGEPSACQCIKRYLRKISTKIVKIVPHLLLLLLLHYYYNHHHNHHYYYYHYYYYHDCYYYLLTTTFVFCTTSLFFQEISPD